MVNLVQRNSKHIACGYSWHSIKHHWLRSLSWNGSWVWVRKCLRIGCGFDQLGQGVGFGCVFIAWVFQGEESSLFLHFDLLFNQLVELGQHHLFLHFSLQLGSDRHVSEVLVVITQLLEHNMSDELWQVLSGQRVLGFAGCFVFEAVGSWCASFYKL